jgi:nucleotide-binding universal stress UspA family protein
MKPILLATDGSPNAKKATDKAIELAKIFGTELVITTVWEIPYATYGWATVPPVGELMQLAREEAEKLAKDSAAYASEKGVTAKTYVVRGYPVQEIGFAADKFEPELIVLGSHGWGPMKRMLFGSVSTGVLHHSTFPVLVVPCPVREQEAKNGSVDEKIEVRA